MQQRRRSIFASSFSMILPRRRNLPRLGEGEEQPRGFTVTRIWAVCLPLSIAIISASILLSQGDAERRPFLLFGIGIVLGVIGLLSLFVGLIQEGNRERARRRARDAARPSLLTPQAPKPTDPKA